MPVMRGKLECGTRQEGKKEGREGERKRRKRNKERKGREKKRYR